MDGGTGGTVELIVYPIEAACFFAFHQSSTGVPPGGGGQPRDLNRKWRKTVGGRLRRRAPKISGRSWGSRSRASSRMAVRGRFRGRRRGGLGGRRGRRTGRPSCCSGTIWRE